MHQVKLTTKSRKDRQYMGVLGTMPKRLRHKQAQGSSGSRRPRSCQQDRMFPAVFWNEGTTRWEKGLAGLVVLA